MKKPLLFFIAIILLNCSTPDIPEKVLSWQEQYEIVTGVQFPKDYKVISNPPMRNGELVRKTIIELSKNDCETFYKNYGFKPISDTVSPFGSRFMDSLYQLIPDKTTFLCKQGKNFASAKYFKYDKQKKRNWLYLVDTSTCRLYCLISYPDANCYVR